VIVCAGEVVFVGLRKRRCVGWTLFGSDWITVAMRYALVLCSVLMSHES
jgi:hypothetical protein